MCVVCIESDLSNLMLTRDLFGSCLENGLEGAGVLVGKPVKKKLLH